jgi:CheY-like chemotaxis protein
MMSPASRPSPRVLLVEDHPDTSEAWGRLLQLEGYHVSKATTLAQARQMCSESRFNAILCDIVLPDGSGLDFPKWAKPRCPNTKIIAMTARVMAADVQAMQDAGFDSILLKPVLPETLFGALASEEDSPAGTVIGPPDFPVII